jgi:hypothetical protein
MVDERVKKYNSEYYRKNKDRINADKKRRYREDPEYRRQMIERARKQTKRNTQKRADEKQKNKPVTYKVRISGKDFSILMFGSRHIADALGYSLRTLHNWESMGILPKALYRNNVGKFGDRLYPEFQYLKIIEAYGEVVKKYGRSFARRRIGQTDFGERLAQLWLKYPKGIDLGNL